MDKYKIDSHKLIYHVDRVSNWLNGKVTYPLYMEISPSRACNHRCTYCGLDFMKYKPIYLDAALLKKRITEFADCGLKSIMYAGEGEPFLHKDMVALIDHTKKSGIDVAITTNGVLMDKEITDTVLNNVEWIKISINGATADTYAKIHRCKGSDFDRVIKNISYAVKVKQKNHYKCALGMQLLLLPENYHEVVQLAKIARDIGVDYLVVKPYSQHPQSETTKYSDIKYNDYEYLASALEKFNTDSFNVIFRISTMKKWDKKEKSYSRCLALPFWSYIDADGNVWGCSVYIKDDKFLYGNIYENSFKQIWEGVKRQKSLKWVETEFDSSNCRVNCRMDEVNKYLWSLKNPPEHVNFV